MSKDEAQLLVRRAQAGDAGALGELYEQFAPEIFRYVLRHLNNHRQDAEDLTDEVFVKALQRLGGYEYRGAPFSAWLYRIARNQVIDHMRTLPRRRAASIDAVPEMTDRAAERSLTGALDKNELTDALIHLSDDQRRAVSLRFLSEYSTAETAAIMGKTEDAIKKLQARGLAQMRRILETGRRAGRERRALRSAAAVVGEVEVSFGAA
jgi:RNA polymerase sigma-70 factor (ECF subfamily)